MDLAITVALDALLLPVQMRTDWKVQVWVVVDGKTAEDKTYYCYGFVGQGVHNVEPQGNYSVKIHKKMKK